MFKKSTSRHGITEPSLRLLAEYCREATCLQLCLTSPLFGEVCNIAPSNLTEELDEYAEGVQKRDSRNLSTEVSGTWVTGPPSAGIFWLPFPRPRCHSLTRAGDRRVPRHKQILFLAERLLIMVHQPTYTTFCTVNTITLSSLSLYSARR